MVLCSLFYSAESKQLPQEGYLKVSEGIQEKNLLENSPFLPARALHGTLISIWRVVMIIMLTCLGPNENVTVTLSWHEQHSTFSLVLLYYLQSHRPQTLHHLSGQQYPAPTRNKTRAQSGSAIINNDVMFMSVFYKKKLFTYHFSGSQVDAQLGLDLPKW